MAAPSPHATFGLLGMLAVRSWTGTSSPSRSAAACGLSGRLRRSSLPRTETVGRPRLGVRSRRNPPGSARGTVTPSPMRAEKPWRLVGHRTGGTALPGRGRFAHFLRRPGNPDDLVTSMQASAEMARSMLSEMLGFVEEYLEEGGPLWMLEHGWAGRARIDRVPWPSDVSRTPALGGAPIDVTTRLLETIHPFFSAEADEWRTGPARPISRSPRRPASGCNRSGLERRGCLLAALILSTEWLRPGGSGEVSWVNPRRTRRRSRSYMPWWAPVRGRSPGAHWLAPGCGRLVSLMTVEEGPRGRRGL